MKRRPKSAALLRRHAVNLLDDFGFEKPPVPIKAIAEWLGIIVRFMPFRDNGDVSGMLFTKDDVSVIGVNSHHHQNRQRFTIAHEIGHFILHKAKEIYIDTNFKVAVNLRDQSSSEATDADEIEANRFAAELLMPYDMIIDDILKDGIDIESETQISILAQKYRVSRQAMAFRIQNILDSA